MEATALQWCHTVAGNVSSKRSTVKVNPGFVAALSSFADTFPIAVRQISNLSARNCDLGTQGVRENNKSTGFLRNPKTPITKTLLLFPISEFCP
jgi:hypothetical protein